MYALYKCYGCLENDVKEATPYDYQLVKSKKKRESKIIDRKIASMNIYNSF